jgi:hypothetical protein
MANNGDGKSKIGEVQLGATETANNLDATAEGLRDQYEDALDACLEHQLAAMGDTHQDDVPKLVELVEGAKETLRTCADSVAASAQQVRAIEERT